MGRHQKTDKRKAAIDMYLDGDLTMAEIGAILGVSRQRVNQYVAGIRQKSRRSYFAVKPTACQYPGLRRWMNNHHVCMGDLVVKIGYEYNPQQAANLKHWLTKNRDAMKMKDIRKVLEVTGMTFEECFGEAEESNG